MQTHADIRLATVADAPAMWEIYCKVVNETCFSFETDAPSLQEFTERFVRIKAHWPWLVATIDGQVAGYTYAQNRYPNERAFRAYQWAVELSVYVHAQYQHKHIALGCYTSLLQILRLLGYHRAYAGIAEPNTASICFHKALGFKQVGVYKAIVYKMDRWHDEAWYEFMLQDHHQNVAPTTPKSISEITSDKEFVMALQKGAECIK